MGWPRVAGADRPDGFLHDLPISLLHNFPISLVSPRSLFHYRMLRTTPPSARMAAPLMATDCVPATKATTAATSSGVSKRLRSEVGRTLVKNHFSTWSFDNFCSLDTLSMKAPAPSEAVGPGRTELT